MERKLTKRIQVGPVAVGGGAPVSIQSMLNTRTTDVEGSLAQIRALAAAGCEIARLAVPDMEAAEAFGDICAASPLREEAAADGSMIRSLPLCVRAFSPSALSGVTAAVPSAVKAGRNSARALCA